jgi:hypothetical protein
MKGKVGLSVYISPRLRSAIKIKAASEGITMAALMEKIIVEWEKYCTQ